MNKKHFFLLPVQNEKMTCEYNWLPIFDVLEGPEHDLAFFRKDVSASVSVCMCHNICERFISLMHEI